MLFVYWEYKLIRSVFLLSKMHLFQNKMKEQINQSIVHRWLRLVPISQAIFEFHLGKMMRLLRRSTNRSIFWLLHKSGNADEPSRVPSIETNGSRKEKRLGSLTGGVRPPISAFPSRFSPILQHWTERWLAGKSVFLNFNSYGSQLLCFWIIPMDFNRTETACWVTPNVLASSSFVWVGSLSSNTSNSLFSNFFGYPQRSLSSTLKSPLLKRRNHSLHDLSVGALSP